MLPACIIFIDLHRGVLSLSTDTAAHPRTDLFGDTVTILVARNVGYDGLCFLLEAVTGTGTDRARPPSPSCASSNV